jgi:hypothetical protein
MATTIFFLGNANQMINNQIGDKKSNTRIVPKDFTFL